MKTIITFLLFVNSVLSFSQQNPLYLENLPKTIKFEFIAEEDLRVSETHKTEFYWAKNGSQVYGLYLITQDLADCIAVYNQFGGFDIYEKLKIEGYQRIVHIRKAGENFKVYYINQENENEKLVVTASIADGHTDVSVLKTSYLFYWTNFLKN